MRIAPKASSAQASAQASLRAGDFTGFGVDLTDPSGRLIDIVGESFHQQTLKKIDSGRLRNFEKVKCRAVILPYGDNPKYPDAVTICAEGRDQIGHLSVEMVREYWTVRKELRRLNWVGVCDAWLKGGRGNKRMIGVMLELMTPEDCLAAIAKETASQAEGQQAPVGA